jgi:NAD(P)H-dependent flavin oxidoreductase YrpB (nitropropane dioxygenase family)
MDLAVPLVAAPMAGGPSTPALVTAAARAGGLGFLAAGYRTPGSLSEQIASVRGAGVPFGVNLFAPNPLPVDPAAYRRYRDALTAEADRLGVVLPEVPVEDDDHWSAKIDLLLADPVPVVSFTFGIPPAAVTAALRRAGTVVAQTVTSVAEARLAADADVLVVQSSAAGGHSGTLTPDRLAPTSLLDLIAEVRGVTAQPLWAAGGLATADDVRAVREAGARCAVLGTVLLLADEAGTSAIHRAALVEDRETVVTRAYTGRPARGLRNRFIDRYEALAPAGYPAIHHLTSPIRRAATDAGTLHLWAGTGYRQARAEPLAATFARLYQATGA